MSGEKLEYLVGTMIELPRAALPCRRDRPVGRFLQLRHQPTSPDHLGLSRDDSGVVLEKYQQRGIMEHDSLRLARTSRAWAS